MAIQVFYDKDADPTVLQTRKVAVLGYGSQGQAHAQNLRDAGSDVLVAQRPGSTNHALAVEHGFRPIPIDEASRLADLLVFALPDETMGDIYNQHVAPHLSRGQALGFIHGFSIRFGQIVPPPDVDVIMIAPKGPGTLVRERFIQGGGLTCFFAVHQNATGQARNLALAWGSAIGGGKGGMIETTFTEECEADLFGEQTVLCGGVIELAKAAFETLVDAGYSPETAYFECVHEIKQVVDMLYADGFSAMRRKISNTAAYGGLTRGPRLISDQAKSEMRAILDEIRSGRFAKEWLAECRNGGPDLVHRSEVEANHPCQLAGQTVRDLSRQALPPK
ncbi:MAG: ketol-acid reductoisomerase [Planctomycetota bacterium]